MSQIKLHSFVAEMDEIAGDFFRKFEVKDPGKRYLLSYSFTQFPGFELFGRRLKNLIDEVSQSMEPKDWDDMNQKGASINKELGALLEPTYTNASYWSPIDELRHSIANRVKIPKNKRKYALACAYAFYGMTFLGEKVQPKLLSIVHYTALLATKKRGLLTCFKKELITDKSQQWIHILPQFHNLLDELGISQLINKNFIENEEISEDALDEQLSRMLINDPLDPWEDLDGILSVILSNFINNALSLRPESHRFIESTRNFFQSFFHEENSDIEEQQISFKQACFMVLTQLLWREACPSQFMYTFTTHVKNNCCILTIGTNKILNSDLLLLLNNFARSLFVHPLLLDYSTKLARSEAIQRINIFRRFLGHNLPKILILPSVVEATKIIDVLKDSHNNEINSAIVSAERLKLLFNHYENILIAFTPDKNEQTLFTGNLMPIDFEQDIYPKAMLIFELMREKRLNENLRNKLKLIPHFHSKRTFIGNQTFLVEIVFNLISNAVAAINPLDIEANPKRAEIHLSFEFEGDESSFVLITVKDFGIGFEKEAYNNFCKICKIITETTEIDFLTTLDGILTKNSMNTTHEDHLGVGLILSVAYLRSLEWHPQIKRSGKIEINTQKKSGSSLTVFWPNVYSDEFVL